MGGRSHDLTLALTLPRWVWDGVWQFSLAITSGEVLCVLDRVERHLPLPPQACRPPSPGLNISHASVLPHDVPTSCLPVCICSVGACSKFERVLPALPLPASLLFLPPLPILFPHLTNLYCLQTSCLLLSQCHGG